VVNGTLTVRGAPCKGRCRSACGGHPLNPTHNVSVVCRDEIDVFAKRRADGIGPCLVCGLDYRETDCEVVADRTVSTRRHLQSKGTTCYETFVQVQVNSTSIKEVA